jgi:hypothetical protein
MERRAFLRTMVAGAGAVAVNLPGGETAAAWARSAARRPVHGLNSHLLDPAAVSQLRDLGVTHVRHTLYWPLWRNPGFPEAFAENVARAHRAGLRLTLVVHNWAGGAVVGAGVSRRLMADFASFVVARARQFPHVEAWQLWNEQDLWVQAPFGASTNLPMVQRGRLYAEQLERAYPLIKRANPRALVVSGGTAEHPSSGFLQGMMESRPPVDAVAIHAYGAYPAFRERVLAARTIVGDHAPIWVTEAGDDASQRQDDGRHLAIWRSVLEGNEREQLAARVFPYVLVAGDGERGHALLRADDSRRPTYEWLRRYLRQR